MKTIDVARLRELLAYEPATGNLRWIVDHQNGILVGDLAGHIRKDGYRVVDVNGSAFKAHRIAWALHYGEWPTSRLDHINRNASDNRIVNLRQVTHAQNIANTQSKVSGRMKGVYWHKQRQSWTSNITIAGKKRYLGLFPTPDQAAAAFKHASREVYGEFARVEAKP